MSQAQNPNADPIVARVNNPGGADLIQVTPPGGGVAWRLNNFQNVWYSGTGSPVTAGVTGMVAGSLYVDTSSGNVWQYSGTSWTQIPGTGSQIYSEVGTAGFRDDFMSNNISIDGTSLPVSFVADTIWGVAAIGGGADTILNGFDSFFSNPGTLTIGFGTDTTSGQGVVIYKDVYANSQLGALGSNANWQLDTIITMGDFSPGCVRIGVCTSGQQASDPPSGGMWVRYDSAQSDSLLTWECRASGVSTTSTLNSISPTGQYVHLRISSTVAGTILFSVNGGAQTAISTNVPQGFLLPQIPFVQILSRQNGTGGGQILDFFSFTVATGRT
jgi:hypothetical protein